MATPLTADQTVAALRKWGVRYREVGNWRTHNRAPRTWGPVHGFGVHHTGDDAPDALDQAVIVNGRAGLPGPLAQFGLNDDGTVDLIGCGRANHFGGGDPAVLQAVIDESYGDYPPASRYHDGSPGAADGNASFYGVETYYSGAQVPKQYRAMVLLATAICDAHGWGEKSVIGHKEWSNWKPDPGSVDMAQFRRDVASCLHMGPQAASGWCYGTSLAPGGSSAKPNPPVGDAPAGDTTPVTTPVQEEDSMIIVRQKERGVWAFGPGYAHNFNTNEATGTLYQWNDKVPSTARLPYAYLDLPDGPSGQTQFDYIRAIHVEGRDGAGQKGVGGTQSGASA